MYICIQHALHAFLSPTPIPLCSQFILLAQYEFMCFTHGICFANTLARSSQVRKLLCMCIQYGRYAHIHSHIFDCIQCRHVHIRSHVFDLYAICSYLAYGSMLVPRIPLR